MYIMLKDNLEAGKRNELWNDHLFPNSWTTFRIYAQLDWKVGHFHKIEALA